MAYPYLHDSSGVVLCTRDGGMHWQREPVMLPALRKIRFWTDRQGWAVGCPSAMFPGGIFTTRDAGRSWQPACSGGTRRIATGDYFDGHNAHPGRVARPDCHDQRGRLRPQPALGHHLAWCERHAGRFARLRLAGGRRRLDCLNRQSRQLVAASAWRASARRGRIRLFGDGRSRTEMLDRRQPRQPRLFHPRRGTNLVRISHEDNIAAAGHDVCRRLARLGCRSTGTDLGQQRWRPDMAEAAIRRRKGRGNGSGRHAPRLATGVARTDLQGPRALGSRRGIGP